MKKIIKLTIGAAMVVAVLFGCGDDETNGNDIDSPYIQGLTLANYPRVDGSTSTEPLNKIIASRLLGIDYKWEDISSNGFYFTRGVVPQISGNLRNIFDDKIKSSQTHNSFINLINGNADIILSARSMSADERAHADSAGVSLIETPIALDAFIFIVNKYNAMPSLTTKQIQEIYIGEITQWEEIDGEYSGMHSGPIVPYVRNANSGSQELMEFLVMNDLEIGEFDVNDYEVIFTMAGALDRVANDPYAICYTVYYYKEFIADDRGRSTVKTIGIDGIHPTRRTIADRSYPLVAEVYAVIHYDLDRSSTAYKIYEWLQTEAGKEVIAASGYVPY